MKLLCQKKEKEKEIKKENTFNYTKFSNDIFNTEKKLMSKLQLNISSFLLNSTNTIAKDFQNKLNDYTNKSQNFTTDLIMKIANKQLNKIEKDNSKLKKIVMENEVIPYIEPKSKIKKKIMIMIILLLRQKMMMKLIFLKLMINY